MMGYFWDSLKWSFQRSDDDIRILEEVFPGSKVEKAPKELDLRGVDYIVETISGGIRNEIYIDVKRRAHCQQYWSDPSIPEIQLEDESSKEKTGWIRNTNSLTDYLLFVYEDINQAFLLPFDLTQLMYEKNRARWIAEFGLRTTYSRTDTACWQSKVLFIPAPEVIEALLKTICFEPNGGLNKTLCGNVN